VKRFRTSMLRSLIVEDESLNKLFPADVLDVELVCEMADATLDSSVLSAVCAAEMSSSFKALETLEMNSPNGLLESALEGVSFFTSDRYFSASAVSPDLMAEIRLLRALPNASSVLDVEEELEVEEVAEEVSSESIVLTSCTLDINMAHSFREKFIEQIQPRAWILLKVISVDARGEWL
jgi:hypothetical protein